MVLVISASNILHKTLANEAYSNPQRVIYTELTLIVIEEHEKIQHSRFIRLSK